MRASPLNQRRTEVSQERTGRSNPYASTGGQYPLRPAFKAETDDVQIYTQQQERLEETEPPKVPLYVHVPVPKTRDDLEQYSAKDLFLATYALHTGELPPEFDSMELRLTPSVDRTAGLHTEQHFLRSVVHSVLLAEGDGFYHWRSLWIRWSMTILSVAFLISALMTWRRPRGYDWLNAYAQENGVLILISLAAVFSLAFGLILGSLIQKLVSFGWRRSLRLFWVRVIPNPSRVRWLESVRSRGVSPLRNVER
jgi:hypothetical protein